MLTDEQVIAREVACSRKIWHDYRTIVCAMGNVTSLDSCIPAERRLLRTQQGMQQSGLLHSCVPSAQANSTPMFGAVGDKTECAITQRSRPIARDRHERVKAPDPASSPRYGDSEEELRPSRNRSPEHHMGGGKARSKALGEPCPNV